MTIEAPCRDTEGCRFGVRLAWTPCRTPASLARFTLWVGVALGLWTVVGPAVADTAPRVRLPGTRKGPRRSRAREGALSEPICPRPIFFAWLHAIEVLP